MLTAARARELLDYDRSTGRMTWRVSRGTKRAGAEAGSLNIPGGFYVVGVDGGLYKRSRLAWLIEKGRWPADEVDHRDCDPANDRWRNLRAATRPQNMCNTRVRARSGLKGAYLTRDGRKFESSITVGTCRIYLGRFDTAEQAHAAWRRAAKKHHGKFRRVA